MDLLFFDTETGGLEPGVSSLLQVGLVAYRDGKIQDKLLVNIKEKNYVVNAYALEYNKLDLYKDIYKCGDEPEIALEKIIDFITRNFKELPILVGHNPSIDKYMLKHFFSRFDKNMDDYISHRMIDTMSLIWGLHIKGKVPKDACSSSGAYSHFGIKPTRLHDALSDCISTSELFEKLIDMI